VREKRKWTRDLDALRNLSGALSRSVSRNCPAERKFGLLERESSVEHLVSKTRSRGFESSLPRRLFRAEFRLVPAIPAIPPTSANVGK
jgi:hypothetical protein